MQRLVAQVLDAWRRAERLTHELPAGSVEHDQAEEACDRLRALYLELTGDEPAITEEEAHAVLAELTETELV